MAIIQNSIKFLFTAWLAQTCWSQAIPSYPVDPLKLKGDLAELMLDGAHRFLDRKLQEASTKRSENWDKKPVEEHRKELARILGVVDPRIPHPKPVLVATADDTSLVAWTASYEIHAVRWPVLDGMNAEGLLLRPTGKKPVAQAIVIPDAGQLPESLAGIKQDIALEAQFARRLAETGCQVLVPTLIDRIIRPPHPRRKNIQMSNREFLHRSAFLMGRTLQGYEIQKILAAVDWLSGGKDSRIGLIGWGEGGLLALRAAALDTRVDTVCVSGHFGSGNKVWEEPLERNVFGLLNHFGDAELAKLIKPRQLFIEAAQGPEFKVASYGAAPGKLTTPSAAEVRKVYNGQNLFVSKPDGKGNPGASKAVDAFIQSLNPGKHRTDGNKLQTTNNLPDPVTRQERTFRQIENFNQHLVDVSHLVREATFQPDLSSMDAFTKSTEVHRERFAREVIGKFKDSLLQPRPRSRQVYDTKKWNGHEIVLDVFPDLFAYGVLLVPKDIKAGEKRPVVVCQHGLEGRPRDIIEGDHHAYHDFAAKLCERGYVVFAPQNPYLMRDKFRSLQRKANPLGKTLFSLIVPQHRQIVKWLGGLPFTDPDRIAFYGLSYGGKTAMRVPALVDGYCLSICSADFNDWIRKTGSTRKGDDRYSYPFTSEYEIFEFNLGHTFNYAEMTALIAPRPFMVERGHFDGVAPDEWVAAEFAKVRRLYARLGIPGSTEIEWFFGPHTINGKGTFRFLEKWLKQ